ncbi:MAG: bifunctional chorismate mutase/prephenate dehydratase [Pseudomonadota bacterium]
MSLEETRKGIDAIDSKILNLINQRMELALQTARYKDKIEDKDREKQVLDRAKLNLGRLISSEFGEKIFTEIMQESKNIQEKRTKLLAFQGEHGAYSELASRHWNPMAAPIPCVDFSGVFKDVLAGKVDEGIIPVENTLGGVVGEVNDLMIHSELFVVGEINMPVHHSLMALPGTDYRDIRVVYSHPQALAQCRNFLTRNKLEARAYYDTAGAAKFVRNEGPLSAAVIASSLCAELYGLEVIKDNIEDLQTNRTRFLIISKNENKSEGNKCSILFSTEHKAGTLFKVLECFAKDNINLTRIDSVPSQFGSYAFFVDFLGSSQDPKVSAVLQKIGSLTQKFRILGFYNERKIET